MSGPALAREGRGARAARARQRRSAARSRPGARSPAPLVTELAHDGDPRPRAVLATLGPAPGRRHRQPRQHLQPRGRRDRRRRRSRAGELLLAPARAMVAQRALRCRHATTCGSSPARFGAESRDARRGALAFEPRDRVERRGDGRHERPARRLPDADRQPRGRHAARARARCARPTSSPARTRARTKVLLDRYGVSARARRYHEHNERARAAELVERMRDGRGRRARHRRRHAAGQRPGLRARAGVRRRRARGRGAARGRARRSPRSSRAGCRPRRWRFVGFLPRKRGRARGGASRRPRRSSRSSRRAGSAASLAVLAALDPERPVAVCRELTKLHEEVVRGHGRRARRALRRREAPRGEVVLVVGGAPADGRRARRRRSTRCAGWSTRARGRDPPPASSPS